ncbi:hypothetical protein ACT7DA_22580 [Bacillus pacificus]
MENANEGTIAIDFTTSTPTLAKHINETGKSKNVYTLDTCIWRRRWCERSKDSQLWSVERKEIYDRCLPLFEKLGTNIQLQGPAGSGQHTKMCESNCDCFQS